MTSCWTGCWIGFTDVLKSARRTLYLAGGSSNRRAHYSETKATVEFETLIDDDDCEFDPTPSFTRHILTDTEQQLVNQRKYDQIVEQQRQLDRRIDAQLQKEEEELRHEEEQLYEAKRQAARAAKQNKTYSNYKEKTSYQNGKIPKNAVNSKLPENTSLTSWVSDDGLSVDSAELDAEDFDSFLEKVKARSLSSKHLGLSSSSTAVSNGVLANGWESSFVNGVEPTKPSGKSSVDAFKILDLSPAESEDRATDVER